MWTSRNTLEFLPLLIKDCLNAEWFVFLPLLISHCLNAEWFESHTCAYRLSLGWFFQVYQWFSSLICKRIIIQSNIYIPI